MRHIQIAVSITYILALCGGALGAEAPAAEPDVSIDFEANTITARVEVLASTPAELAYVILGVGAEEPGPMGGLLVHSVVLELEMALADMDIAEGDVQVVAPAPMFARGDAPWVGDPDTSHQSSAAVVVRVRPPGGGSMKSAASYDLVRQVQAAAGKAVEAKDAAEKVSWVSQIYFALGQDSVARMERQAVANARERAAKAMTSAAEWFGREVSAGTARIAWRTAGGVASAGLGAQRAALPPNWVRAVGIGMMPDIYATVSLEETRRLQGRARRYQGEGKDAS